MDELKKISKPGKFSKENPFTVPDHYFSEFPDQLKSRLNEDRKRSRNLLLNWKPYAAAAIILIVVVVAGSLIFRNFKGNSVDQLNAQISTMVENELYSINEQTILEAIAQEPDQQEYSGFKQDEAIDYLLNGNLDENDLLNEL